MNDHLHDCYDQSFYDSFRDSSLRSAEVIVPLVMEWCGARSVVDVGCGLGIWLSVFLRSGVQRVLGLDGPHVTADELVIPADCFRSRDLARAEPVGETFDLAMSLEVAEHLPPPSADPIVGLLTSLAPVVLFSAAIPGQPGTHHVNAQWHDYWHRKFGQRGFVALDPLRPRLWHDEAVSLHYRQNLFLYVKQDRLAQDRQLSSLPAANCLTLVDQDAIADQLGLRATLARLPRLVARKLFPGGGD